ncbi:hypothetical protein vB_AbaM_Acibel004_26 [Acinetobacter phage vB_AbaM_Acibel004]|uniref:hypothetical protein n=1 Tax=Acinetobacter phage vB_AbaM_Acibel004 TaxID=1481186 RepID=UPI0004E85EB4|nr:hypothetical protein vB_AbaM_Acibel004_26 [Acinetobacter phage vB_AbaM_Acibel004]AHY26641.1 hypothetical protein vB_AbaM_Acibel004_26 [Acinetobacter phage vB_AbaM_Acibel004]
MREQELEKRVLKGEKVPVLMKGVIHYAWYMPKEDFGFKHTLTYSPMVTNRICRSFNDLLYRMSEVDPNWVITEVKEEEIDE